ncbi:MAG: UDP-N-acetylmuramate--alanine ligase [Candidatus Xenolissoclinum pacificiensis L6]|uniref:UDP-N-acetylmuramate--L-alanine ligase n=1 Tax=Candidatus Xenolissoclinum pacificiensis L6 TaxID=1401685 RepID=W2V0X2_9RICK|nr:MAG: UDP-N-acetylmuramate--alanine ligase [Candidatus Xenolissoclinum pacificiensis L6]
MLDKSKEYFIVGIGGIGMSAIARLFHSRGYGVSGSDSNHNAIIDELIKSGIRVYIGQKVDNIQGSDILIRSTAIPDSNPEIIEAKRLGKEVLFRKEALAMILKDYDTVAVTGSHGKTTVTTLLESILNCGNLTANVLCGGIIKKYNSNCVIAPTQKMVVEADESDGTFTYIPKRVSITTNIDREHLDYYKTFDNLLSQFQKFINDTDSIRIVNSDDVLLREICERLNYRNIITYSLDGVADYIAKNIIIDKDGSRFDVYSAKGDVYYSGIRLAVPGEHNISNAMATIAFAHNFSIPEIDLRESLKNFENAKRRFEKVGSVNGVDIVDDYAHSPEEIEASIKMASSMSYKRIISIIQPHRYSRVREFFEEYRKVCMLSDVTILCPVFPAGESRLLGYDSSDIISGVQNKNLLLAESEDKLYQVIRDVYREGDLLLFMGAGNITHYAKNMSELIK